MFQKTDNWISYQFSDIRETTEKLENSSAFDAEHNSFWALSENHYSTQKGGVKKIQGRQE